MAMRILFGADDLCRTRVAPGADLLWELVLSITKLQQPHPPPQYRM